MAITKLSQILKNKMPNYLNRDLGDNPKFMIRKLKKPQKFYSFDCNYFDGTKFLLIHMLQAIRKSDDIVF